MKLLLKTAGSLLCLSLAGLAAWWILKRRRPDYTDNERFLAWLTCLVPFSYGGYYTISAAAVGGLLLVQLIRTGRRQHGLRIYGSLPAIGVAAVTLGYCLSAIWAVNRGMGLYGIAKYLPLSLYALLRMQTGPDAQPAPERESSAGRILTLLPFSGCMLVLLALVLQFVPGFEEAQVVTGRLAGFFEYPNTLALFLMLGIAVAVLENRPDRWTIPELVILTFGVFGSGSRIGFALLALEFLILCLMLRKRRPVLTLAGIFIFGLVLSLLLGRLEALEALSRYTTSTQETSSFLTRLLYYRDALPVILRHPFGLGYWGYASQRQVFQHGVYHVVHVHNDLLQLLLDIGWIPTVLLVAGMIASFIRRKAGGMQRLCLVLIAAYCMFEFHLAYLSIWLILITCLRLQDGPCRMLRLPGAARAVCLGLSGCVFAGALWLGTGEALNAAGWRQAAIALTPVYTPALSHLVGETEDPALQQQYAQKLVKLDPCNRAAWQVLAQNAWDAGDEETALTLQERTIACSPYQLESYLKYFDMLDSLYQRYEAAGDSARAEAFLEKLLAIPEALQQVLDTTDPLAWKIEHTPELTLPEAYRTRLAELEQN